MYIFFWADDKEKTPEDVRYETAWVPFFFFGMASGKNKVEEQVEFSTPIK